MVLTGGPGAGKSAVLELARLFFCDHVRRLPEAAGIVFGLFLINISEASRLSIFSLGVFCL
ncbi:MAG: hypothetical protein IBJ19_04065 [Gemmatimonadaceae bacterium]|nr:hypothetical protein [Gemmatimonadaceae bacterium]